MEIADRMKRNGSFCGGGYFPAPITFSRKGAIEGRGFDRSSWTTLANQITRPRNCDQTRDAGISNPLI